jgi:hypothetical protein
MNLIYVSNRFNKITTCLLSLIIFALISFRCGLDNLGDNPVSAPALRPVSSIPDNSAIPMDFLNWKCWTGTTAYYYIMPTTGVFEKTSTGLLIYGTGYRSNIRLQLSPIASFPLYNKTIYLKWKANGNGSFMGTGAHLWRDSTYTDVFRDGNTYTGKFTTGYSYDGSYAITDNMWYFTRILIALNKVTTITATGNYDNSGGEVIQRQEITKSAIEYKVLTWGIWDTYGEKNQFGILGEAKIE